MEVEVLENLTAVFSFTIVGKVLLQEILGVLNLFDIAAVGYLESQGLGKGTRISKKVRFQHIDEEMYRHSLLLAILQELVQRFPVEIKDGFDLTAAIMLQIVDQDEKSFRIVTKELSCRERDFGFSPAGDLPTSSQHLKLQPLEPGSQLTNAAFNNETADTRRGELREQLW